MHHTVGSSSAVCMIPPLSQALRCASHHRVKLCVVHHIAESWKKVYEKTPWCAFPRGVILRDVHPSTESSDPNFSKNSVVCTPRSQDPGYASYLGVKLCGAHHTEESSCIPLSQNRNLWESLVAFKGTVRRNPFRGEHIYHERKYFFRTLWSNISAKLKSNSIIPCLSGT